MSTIIFVVSLLWPAPGPISNAVSELDTVVDSVEDDGPMRYRGIEQLLAEFEAQANQKR